jgi:drug/metabolite transporter (DMT)-like permease
MFAQPSRPAAILQALFVAFLWSTSYVLIKIGLEDIPALTFAGLRYFVAFLLLLPLLPRGDHGAALRTLHRRAWLRLGMLGLLLYAGTQGAQFVALAYLPAVTVNLLWSFSSVAVAVLGIGLLGERPAGRQWAGIGLATAGALLYFYPAGVAGGQLLGLVVALAGVGANAGAAVVGRRVNRARTLHPLPVTVVSMGLGAVVLLGAGLLTQGLPPLGWRSWLIITWLAVVNTAFAFTLWNHTLRVLTATESSVLNGTMLIWIPILAVLFLGETVTAREVLGLVVTGVGTLLVQLRRRRRRGLRK